MKRSRPSLVVDSHNLIGMLAAIGTIIVCVTGILLNHIDPFELAGAAPDPSAGEPATLPIPEIIEAGQSHLTAETGTYELNRAVWNITDGATEVRFEGDGPPVSVTIDSATGELLGSARRHDIDLTQAHSGELIGGPWIILSDLVGIAWVVLVVLGVIIWLRRSRSRGRLVGARPGNFFVKANWWFHLVGGLAAAVFLVVLALTGILLNHKRELGIMADPPTLPDHREDAGYTPLSISQLLDSAVEAREGDFMIDDVRSLDYRPKGYAKVRFTDADHEVILDGESGELIKQSRRWDAWIEDLHSGLLFGAKGWLLSEFGAVMGILLTLNGIYVWLYPTWRMRNRRSN